ncbi:hypothetical protein [Nocardioides speluncae]|uniref:hypothetical protein n=1 Tax=Nocardioides speluncae TaxID=2670337 RepID=UPI000D6857C3|nr:hypothetical protein [Nocardioides speluncae]
MAAPVITQNTLTPGTVQPGGSSEWRTIAQDPDSQTETIRRTVTDSQGNVTTFESQLIVSDPLTYGPPSCDDPRVSFVVDSNDPTLVHVSVAS